jgi:plasmid stabilization system protein ParE
VKHRFLAEALTEYERAAVYYEERQEGLGARFIIEVDEALALALEFPSAGSRVMNPPEEFDIRRVLLHTFPYELDYLVHDNTLIVLAVFHVSQRPGTWLHRIDKLR